ncbi:cellulase-like family protein [Streptomyces sp. CA-111067]|uniref:cellulase-like family protein n=1 Tax=Streptomyces sp. CA-111067 TaxID=3240046 RepID=UPI003D984FCA
MPAPRAVTMWDFSWLLRRDHDENEYADVDAVLDQLAERGYDVVRIDAFPHWIAADRDGRQAEEIVAEPQPPGFMWGNHTQVAVEPRAALLEFLAGLRRRGIQAGLSTWFTPDTTRRSEHVATPADLARIWTETLAVVRDAGLLDAVAYVDLCNEWPGWAPGISREVFGERDGQEAPPEPFTEEQLRRIDGYQESLEEVKKHFAGIPVTFSFFLRGATPPLSTDMMRLSTTSFDFAEPHLWLSSGCPDFIARTAYVDDYSPDVRNLTGHQHLVHARYAAERTAYLAELGGLLDAWRDWAAGRGLPLWTTEGWASIGWSPDLVPGWDGWEYVKDVGAAAVAMALERGWQGVCTSNFSQPHHTGMWADAAWHREQTGRIREGRTA